MHFEEDYAKIADYFVVAGLTDTSKPLDEELAFPDANHKLSSEPKDPIIDVCIIDRTLEERCPQGFTCIENTPSGQQANLNHGSITAHDLMLCYKRGKNRPPLVEIGVYYEGMEKVKNGIDVVKTTPTGKTANINNKTGIGSHAIYLTYQRAKESDPQNTLVVTDLCIILTNKGEQPPYAYCLIDKNINKGMIGSSVYICYKKSMRQVNSIAFTAGLLSRYPREDIASFGLPSSVGLFCLPMGATIECWTDKTKHPLPSFSTFVLTTETFEKIYGAVVSFYEAYPEEKLQEEHKYKLGLLRGDGHKSHTKRSIHTNKAICLLSRWPLFDAFRDFLVYLYRLTVSPQAHPVPVERYISHFLHKVPFPTQHRPRVHYQMSPMHATILTRPQITPIPLSGASFVALLDDLGADNLLSLLTLALTEHKIVIHSLRQAEITRVAEALITLLFPFKWQCTYVPLCPLEMAYVLEAPTPFIVGVDSRYFDLYEPPRDVICVNLDTNSITQIEDKKVTWKMLPKKYAKPLYKTLQSLFTEIKQSNLSDDPNMTLMLDPDVTRTRRLMQIEIIIQEAVLKLMVLLMAGYRDYLLPIIQAPNVGATDAASLFNFTDFVRHRDRSSHRFYTSFTNTQMFLTFVEERSFSSGFVGDRGEKAASLVFFDECIMRMENEQAESVRLIETDESIASGPTVFIMPPDEKGLPENAGFQYTIFPELQEELFVLEDESDEDSANMTTTAQRRKSSSFAFGKRTKQETRITQKEAAMNNRDPVLWARTLLSSTFSIWFNCLSEFTKQCKSKAAALRAGHNALFTLQARGCMPLPDETSYRVLMHLCYVYNKPALAVRIFHFIRNSGGQLSALTYGLYNKALLESKWPTSNRDGFMLWQKLRNVLMATVKLRYALRYQSNNNSVVLGASEGSSEYDSASRTSVESGQAKFGSLEKKREKTLQTEEFKQTETNPLNDERLIDTQSDHGYNSLPKDVMQPSFPKKTTINDIDQNGTETTDSVISSTSESTTDSRSETPRPEYLLSGRNVQPPTTLSIPEVHIPDGSGDYKQAGKFDQGLQSDETIVNNEYSTGPGGDNILTGQESGLKSTPIVRTPGTPGSAGSGGFESVVPNNKQSDETFGMENTNTLTIANTVNESTSKACTETNDLISLSSMNDVLISTACTANSNVNLPSDVETVYTAQMPLLSPKHVGSALNERTEGENHNHTNQKPNSDTLTARYSPYRSSPVPFEESMPELNDEEVFVKEKKSSRLPYPKSFPTTDKDEISPGTPELATFFGGDSKFLAGLSDSDKKRHQELSERRPSSIDSPGGKSLAPGSGTPMNTSRDRSASAQLLQPHQLAVGGGISPLVGHKLGFSGGSKSVAGTPVGAGGNNFDSLTADDLIAQSSTTSPRHRSIFSSGGSARSRHIRSPIPESDVKATTPSRRHIRTAPGTCSLQIVDGVAMLTSTPMRNLPSEEQKKELRSESNSETFRFEGVETLDSSNASTQKNISQRQLERQDITDLSLDPLSALSIESPVKTLKQNKPAEEPKLGRHLVEEIELHQKRDSFSNSGLSRSQSVTMEKSNSLKKSISEQVPKTISEKQVKEVNETKPVLSRSLTFHNDTSNSLSNSFFGSGSKFNSLWKTTTIGMATKAKKLASDLAKDFNDTVQTNLAYYTPEKFKGSLTDLLREEDATASQHSSRNDLYSSQSSLRSSESQHSGTDGYGYSGDEVRRRTGSLKTPRRKKASRPLSLPSHGTNSTTESNTMPTSLQSSLLGVPGMNQSFSPDVNISASTNSLNAKGITDIDVMMSSCSKCHKCHCLVYDEEIMAGWIADESNLNTHCPFCSTLFVPFLNIEIKDFRKYNASIINSKSNSSDQNPSMLRSNSSTIDESLNPVPESENPLSEEFSASFNLPLNINSSINSSHDNTANASSNQIIDNDKSANKMPLPNPPTNENVAISPEVVISPPILSATETKPPNNSKSSKVRSSSKSPKTKRNSNTTVQNSSSNHSRSSSGTSVLASQSSATSTNPQNENIASIEVLEPLTVPYLSPLVLRKNMESLLENEGTHVLTDPNFIDQHPIMYWNLIWYFRRLNLHSNLYNLLLSSKALNPDKSDEDGEETTKTSKGMVTIHTMWDNLKLHKDMAKPPFYWAWHQAHTQQPNYLPYPLNFLNDIRDSIIKDDVRGPLVSTLHELSSHGPNALRRSAYREILYLVIVALDKDSIDCDAFDRVYEHSYNQLSVDELTLVKRCDKLLNRHARECRNIFGQLDLY